MVSYVCVLLNMLAAEREPTPCYRDAHSVDTPKWAFWVKGWLNYCKTTFSPLFGRFFLVRKDNFLFFGGEEGVRGGLLYGCFTLGGPGILGLANVFYPGQLSIEFVNVGGWLTHGDLALDSCAQFLAVAEHRLIPSGARSVCHQLRRAGHHSVWSLACQDHVAGGHAGVGVVSLGGAAGFENHFPIGKGGAVHLFDVDGYQGAEEDSDRLLLTDKLLQAVLAEALVVCIGQPMLYCW